MDELKKLKINLSCLIRLARTELYDSLEDIKRNNNLIDLYTKQDSVKYEKYINQLKSLNDIYTDTVIKINNKLKSYFKDLKDYNLPIEIDSFQNILEQSINDLEINKNKLKHYKNLIKDKSIIIISSETDYLTNEVLLNYEILEQSKLEKYKQLTKKYN